VKQPVANEVRWLLHAARAYVTRERAEASGTDQYGWVAS